MEHEHHESFDRPKAGRSEEHYFFTRITRVAFAKAWEFVYHPRRLLLLRDVEK